MSAVQCFKTPAHRIEPSFFSFNVPERIIPLFILAEKGRPYIRSEHTEYISNLEAYDKRAERLDFKPCPYCRVVGCLNRHGKRSRYNERTGKETVCAAREFCNDRGNMGGCGCSYSVVFLGRMHQYIVACETLWNFLLFLLAGQSIKNAWKPFVSMPHFCTDNGYKLRQAFIRSQSHIRTLLSKLGPPGKFSGVKNPVFQTIQQLKSAFNGSSCPVSAFQLRFQKPFLV